MNSAVAREYLEAEAFEWEMQYGTDTLCPKGHKYEGYPYWVEYMPRAIREVYMSEVKPYEMPDYHN
jgi:aspartyl/asparaginyl-tRNA synthetase